MPQVIIYAAKSTKDDGYSIPDQIMRCREYATAQGWDVVEPPESDENKSAFSGSRGAGLVRAKERGAAAPDGTVLLAFSSDRFARGDVVDATHLVEHVIDGLKGGYRVASVKEHLGGEMALVFGALYGERAHADSKAKSEHTKRGVAVSAAAGRVNGGPRRYGFEKADGSGTLTPRPAEVAVVQSMFEMARAGKTQTVIARELSAAGHRTAGGNPWSQPKVGQMLANPIWIGQLVRHIDEKEVTFQIMEPLIPVELYHAVQRTLSKDGKRRGRHSQRFLLANGLLRCGGCGSAMSIRRAETPAGTREHYRCMGRRSGATDCKQPDVPREPIDTAVLAYFEQIALDVTGTVKQLTGERNRRLAEVDAKLTQARKVQAEAERDIERLDALLRAGMTLEEWRRVVAVPQRDAEATALELDDLTAEREQVESAEDVMDATSEFMERIAAVRSAVGGEVTGAEGITLARWRCGESSTGSGSTAPTHPRHRIGSTPS